MAKQHQNQGQGQKNQKQRQGGGAPMHSPLEPQTPKELRHQAAETMRAIYKPAFKQLGREKSRLISISEKRTTDNAYYLKWLTEQGKQLQAHEDAANASLLAAGQEAQKEVTDGYQTLHDQLVAGGAAQPGVVSNPGEATAFDVSAEAQRDSANVEAARQKTLDQIGQTTGSGALAQANNFAVIAAAEAQNQSQKWKALAELGDKKQELRLTKAAETAKEVARLFDREIQKAQISGQLRASSATAALEAQKFGLSGKKFQLESEKFDFEKNKTNREFNYEKRKNNRKFGLEQRKQKETERYDTAKTEIATAKTHQEKVKASHKITAVIQEGISTIASNKNLQKELEKNPDKVKKALMKILGSATAASAAVELVSTGELNPTTREDLRQIGYIIPSRWR